MIASSFGRLKDMSPEEVKAISRNDIARSLLTLVFSNMLLFSKILALREGIKRVVMIGSHVDIPEYMQMSEQAFALLTNQEAELIFPTYSSFLGSLGLLLQASHMT